MAFSGFWKKGLTLKAFKQFLVQEQNGRYATLLYAVQVVCGGLYALHDPAEATIGKQVPDFQFEPATWDHCISQLRWGRNISEGNEILGSKLEHLFVELCHAVLDHGAKSIDLRFGNFHLLL